MIELKLHMAKLCVRGGGDGGGETGRRISANVFCFGNLLIPQGLPLLAFLLARNFRSSIPPNTDAGRRAGLSAWSLVVRFNGRRSTVKLK